jgi:hypothetical protein
VGDNVAVSFTVDVGVTGMIVFAGSLLTTGSTIPSKSQLDIYIHIEIIARKNTGR